MERGPAIRSAGILVAVTASVVVTFLVATIAAEHHASNITARVGDIARNAMPSVQLLSRARGAVMKIIVDIDEIDARCEPYFQGGAGTVGIGLGLATVERLVQAHGGRVGVRSAVPHGSVFWFELSTATASSPIATASAQHPTVHG